MKLNIRNLAHIHSAKIDDSSDLTIIIGDNGTGKTLLLETYTLLSEEINKYRLNLIDKLMTNNLEHFEVVFEEEDLEFLFEIYSIQKNIINELIEEEFPRRYIRQAISDKLNNLLSDDHKQMYLPYEINISSVKSLNKQLELYANEVKNQFKNLVETKILFNSGKIDELDFINHIPTFSEVNPSSVSVSIGPSYWRVNRRHLISILDPFLKNTVPSFDTVIKRLQLNILRDFVQSTLDSSFIDTRNSDVLLIPTERNSIIANSNLRTRKELESNKIFSRYSEFAFTVEYLKFKEEIGQHDISFFDEVTTPLDIEEYTLELDAFNNNFSDLDFDINSDDSLEDEDEDEGMFQKEHSKKLTEMLGGYLQYDKYGELKSIIDFNGNTINSRLFSTKQNHISSFAILEENLDNYDVVIIEEPESNLSLKAIKELVDYLIDLIKTSNIKMVLTTHNELFFQRLNLSLMKNSTISSSVYEFIKKDGKNVLDKAEKNDYGYSVELFTKELDEIFQETVDIQNSLEKDQLDDND